MLSLVCPVYNEAGNIGRLLDAVTAQIRVPFELTIVYDFDDDDTLPVVRERMQASPFEIRLVKNKYGRGALNAVKTGLEEGAGCTAVAVTMADLSDDLNDINTMYELIEGNCYDVVCGSRYMRGGRQIGGPPLKSLMSRTAGLSLHILTGIPTHDATNNFKMYRGSFVAASCIQSQAGFEIGLEMVVKAYVNGYRVGEIPTVWRDRVAGTSRFNIRKWLPHYLRWYRYAFRRRVALRDPQEEAF
jgi:dolichol-phosphate mannosyltransferase